MIELFDVGTDNKIKKSFLSKTNQLINNKDFILGQDVHVFEKKVSAFLNSKYSVGVNSGTDALELALRCAGVTKNSKVIVPGFSFFATSEVIYKLGAEPVFCDISKKDLCIDIEDVQENFSNKIKAVIPVHLFGNFAEIKNISKLKKEFDFKIIEDVAQAFGSSLNGKKAGTIGDFGAYSFYPTKNLGAIGDAGLITTNTLKNNNVLRMLRNHGQKERYKHEFVGYNSRLDSIQAIILNEKLKSIDKSINKRILNSQRYLSNFTSNERIITHAQHNQPMNIFPVSFDDIKIKERVKKVFRENNISFGEYYPIGLNNLPMVKGNQRVLKNVNWATQNILSLPCHPNITFKQIDFISNRIYTAL